MQLEPVSTPAVEEQVEHLIVFVARQDPPVQGGAAAAVDGALDGAVQSLAASGELTGKRGRTVVLHSLGKLPAPRAILCGVGEPEKLTLTALRNAVAGAARRARDLASGSLAIAAEGPPLDGLAGEAVGQAIAEGVLLGLYRFDRHQSPSEPANSLERVTVHGSEAAALERGIERGRIFAEAANFARDLANEPSNLLTPTELAARATAWGDASGLETEILEEAAAEQLGMGSFLGVARGSHQPAKFIVLRHRGGGEEPGLALIGKGITFDTGGISIKPAANMAAMKQDMSGAAAVIAAIGAIGRLGLPINVTALAPATENMPGGNAIKPGDVLTAMNGTTIEVLNTDAEGRLILADALAYANSLGLTPLVDVATLTGACAVALGNVATGVMGNDDALVERLVSAGEQTGEKFWQLPMFEEYDEQIKSSVADVKNTGGRLAGAITAAKLLAKFAGETPWIHLDMAGTDDADKTSGVTVKGATGIPVRSLIQLAIDSAGDGGEGA